MTKLLHRKLQPPAPLAERRLGLCEHPGNTAYRGKVDLAGFAVKLVVNGVQRRLVAARAGEEVDKFGHGSGLCTKTASRREAAGRRFAVLDCYATGTVPLTIGSNAVKRSRSLPRPWPMPRVW